MKKTQSSAVLICRSLCHISGIILIFSRTDFEMKSLTTSTTSLSDFKMENKKDLLDSLRAELRKGGIVRAVTTQLKKEVCEALNESSCSRIQQSRRIQTLEHAAMRSLVMEYLICDELECTISVFSSESGLDEHYLSKGDVLKAFDIRKGSKLYEELLSYVEDSSKTIESSTLYRLLTTVPAMLENVSTQSASTQTWTTENGNLKARTDLNKQLKDIQDKYSSNRGACSHTHRLSNTPDGLVESNMFAFQKECEERERKRMERKLEEFKRSLLASMEQEAAQQCLVEVDNTRREMKVEHDRSIEVMRNKAEQLKKDFVNKEKEREYQQLALRQKLMKEIEDLKQRENDTKNVIDIERRKLQLEEQRVKHILMSAEAKLEFAEAKEKEVRESVANEFSRVRLAAKQTYDDASVSVRKQSAFYAKELDELNGRSNVDCTYTFAGAPYPHSNSYMYTLLM